MFTPVMASHRTMNNTVAIVVAPGKCAANSFAMISEAATKKKPERRNKLVRIRSVCTRGGGAGSAARRTGEPQQRDQQDEQDGGDVEELERRQGERLHVHHALEERVALLGGEAHAAEEIEGLDRRRIGRRQVLD